MERVKVFKNNESQTIGLPESVALPDEVEEVDIIVSGRCRIIMPAGEAWNIWFESEGVTDDFMEERGQFQNQQREDL